MCRITDDGDLTMLVICEVLGGRFRVADEDDVEARPGFCPGCGGRLPEEVQVVEPPMWRDT